MPTDKRDACVPYDILNLDEHTRIHLNTFKPSHRESMCKSMASKAYCNDGFYGPIFPDTSAFDGEMFYFSGFEKKGMSASVDFLYQEN